MRTRATLAMTAIAALAPGQAEAAAAENPSKMGAEFVQLSEITTPIFGTSRVEGALSVTIVLEARDAKVADGLRGRMPELRATAVLATLEFSRLYASGFAPVNAVQLSSALNRALRERYPGVARVLITSLEAVPA
jgi:flagellar basal body-associated protein FliL